MVGAASARASQYREPILAEVKTDFVLIRQRSPQTCWATVATMVIRWRDQQPHNVDDVMTMAGERYVTMAREGRPLASTEKDAFLDALSLVAEVPQNFTLPGWQDLVKAYGPLWVTVEGDGDVFSAHAVLLVGLRGDGTPEGTAFRYVDPILGLVRVASAQRFLDNFDEIAIADLGSDRKGDFRAQVVHLKGARP